jgi:hypothetical protein
VCGDCEPAHVRADLGQNGHAGDGLNAGNRLKQLQRQLKGGQPTLDLHLDVGDRLSEEVDVRQHLPGGSGCVAFLHDVRSGTCERLDHFRVLVAEPGHASLVRVPTGACSRTDAKGGGAPTSMSATAALAG